MNRIAITGALGHIGSRFIQGIRPGDFGDVLLLDNLLTQRYGSLFNLPRDVPFRFFREDVLTADLARRFEGVDAVLHLAAVTDAAASFQDPAQAEQVNFLGTEKVAEACLRTGSRLILLSTTSVYGADGATVDEACDPSALRPQSPYAVSKLRAERLLEALAPRGLKYATCRFGTIYGVSPGMRFHTAVNKFAWQAVLGQPLTVWRTALRQLRPYLDLSDAVRALRFLLDRDLFENRVYNVLTDNATVEDILNLLRREVPALSVDLVDSAAMNALSYSVSRARFEALGFEFQGSLENGIRDTVHLLRHARAGAGAG